jgi:hypothetical protein
MPVDAHWPCDPNTHRFTTLDGWDFYVPVTSLQRWR